MANKIESYRRILAELDDWQAFLKQASGLPGPRANLELAQAVADLGDEKLFLDLLENDPLHAPVNSPDEFLAFCGVLGLGKLVTQSNREHLARLRQFSADPRWRIREAVAMGLQRLGETDMNFLLDEMGRWSTGDYYEKRAAVAALAEPKLLVNLAHIVRVLDLFDLNTTSIQTGASHRKEESFQALRKCLGYAWSVVIAASPQEGMKRFERWLSSPNPDVRWIMKENLGKKRMQSLDQTWLDNSRRKLEDTAHVP